MFPLGGGGYRGEGSKCGEKRLGVLGDGGDDDIPVRLDAVRVVVAVDLCRKDAVSSSSSTPPFRDRISTHLPCDRLIHRRRRRPSEHILKLGPPASAGSKVVCKGNDDATSRDVPGGGDSRLSVADRVGELLERVLLKIVVVAAL